MGEDVVLNGNGKNGFAVPLALFLVIISGIVGGAIAVTRMTTQIENLQYSIDKSEIKRDLDKKDLEEKIKLYEIRVVNLDKEVAIIKDRKERGK